MSKYTVNKDIYIEHHFMPGENLSDVKLKQLQNRIIALNKEHQIDNKALQPNLNIADLRSVYKDLIIGEFVIKNQTIGVMISPFFDGPNSKKVVHSGLVIISKNPGFNVMDSIGIRTYIVAYKELGTLFATNITSKPAGIESFSSVIRKCWPQPDSNLKFPPKKYQEVLPFLKERYINNFFPDNGKNISIDKKRFIMRSKCQEMGFSSDFSSATKAQSFKFNSFCHTWISYEDEEDLIQVGEVTLVDNLWHKLLFAITIAQIFLKKPRKVHENKKQVDLSISA